MKKGTRGNNSYISETILILSILLSSAVCPLVNAKVEKDPIKLQEPMVDKTGAISKNSINSLRKMPMKKGTLGNNSLKVTNVSNRYTPDKSTKFCIDGPL